MLRFITLPSGPVFIAEWTPESNLVFALADRWSHHADVQKAVEITAIDNGTHGAGTLHGHSRAWDLCVEGKKLADLQRVFDFLHATLPPGFDVVLEASHVHVEWQPKR
jgi:hypothetical protein